VNVELNKQLLQLRTATRFTCHLRHAPLVLRAGQHWKPSAQGSEDLLGSALASRLLEEFSRLPHLPSDQLAKLTSSGHRIWRRSETFCHGHGHGSQISYLSSYRRSNHESGGSESCKTCPSYRGFSLLNGFDCSLCGGGDRYLACSFARLGPGCSCLRSRSCGDVCHG